MKEEKSKLKMPIKLLIIKEKFSQVQIYNQGIEKNDESVCSMAYEVNESEGSCLREIALAKNDISICGKINNDFQNKVGCFTEFAIKEKNVSYCSILSSNTEKDVCLFWISSAVRNPSLCDRIDFKSLTRENLYSPEIKKPKDYLLIVDY